MLVSTAYRVQVLAACLVFAATIELPSTSFGVDLFSQDFDSVTLGPIVTYQTTQVRSRKAWSPTFPAGWAVDNSVMPGVGDDNLGVTEFEGWTVVDKNWWVANEDQGRGSFFNGLGNVAVADSDEHDDLGNPAPQTATTPFDSKLTTPSISLMGAAANTVNVSFHSAWQPEEIQKATLTARYNNGTDVEVLRWHSESSDPMFHAGALNETVMLPLQNPAGASSVTLEFRLFDATNNWYWAIDNLNVFSGVGAASDSVLRAVVDRNTSNVKIVNNTGEAVNLRGYSLRSGAGAFDAANATFLADSDPNWVQLTQPSASSDLSEGHLSAFNFENNGTINLGNDVWEKFFRDDVTMSYLVAGSDLPIPAIVEFTGNAGVSFPFLDLNFSGAVEIGDWDTFRAGFPVSLSGLSEAQRYQLGDLDNDGLHTPTDFITFRTEFDAALGAGAFETMLAASQVPEPASSLLVLMAMCIFGGAKLHRQRSCGQRILPAIAAVVLATICSTSAQAQLTLFSENFDSVPLGPSIEEEPANNVWTDTPPAGWTKDDSGVPGVNNPQLPTPNNNGMIEWAGWAITDKIWWSTVAGGQGREQFARGSGNVMVADPDEWDDQPHPDANETTGSTADCVGDTVNPCMYDAFITTRPIAIPAGIPAGKIMLGFDSSWDDEGNDDSPHLANNQRATINVSYNGGAPVNVMTWDSVPTTSPNYHGTAYNEGVERNLEYDGTATTMTLTFGLDLAENDWWWAVDNLRVFVPANPSKLVVNTVTGQATLVGGDVIPASINYIDITSENGVLNGGGLSGFSASTPDSVDGPDADATVGNSSGETWQVLAATDTRVAEAFLFGSSTFMNTRMQNLGAIFDTSTLPAERDISFTYTNIFNNVISGLVEYVDTAPVGITGDYNNNGVVDAADYVVWRNSLGQSVTLPNDASPGTVTDQDYTAWRSNFGRVASGAALGASVPEPATVFLLAFATMAAALGSNRSRRRAGTLVLGTVAAAALAAPSLAQLPPPPVLDRDYRMGDDDPGPPSTGSSVISTFDSAGVVGMNQLIDLSAVAGPRYEALPTTSGGPVPRRPDNGTGLAIRLNPNAPSQGQYLRTGFQQALNFPERSPSSTLGGLGGTIDYEYIRDRGFQLWALPQTAARADIVMDSNQHGVLINSNGQFAMRYAGGAATNIYDSNVSVIPNTWYHLMVVRPSGSGRGSILYVNGNAVAAANGTYAGDDNPALNDTTPLVIGANTGTGLQPGQQNRFQGLVDDLEMFVMGINASQDYGEFVFERDNKYAAFFKPTVAADLTGDSLVNMADVDIFVDNWLFQNRLNWTQIVAGAPESRSLVVGDLSSRMKGDFNYDGFVDIADWEILNDLAPSGVGAAALALINATVPEPGGLVLAALASAAALGSRRATRRLQTRP